MPTEKILLVESNPRVVEMLVEAFVRRFNSNITCVASAEDALDVEMVEPHSIVLADTALPRMDAVLLAQRLRELADRPVILMGTDVSASDAIELMRAGASDFFRKPFEVGALLDSMQQAMQRHADARLMRYRYDRMRQLLRRVIRDRRQLNRRVDLICKDLVGAHKRLVLRVLDREPTRGGSSHKVEARG